MASRTTTTMVVAGKEQQRHLRSFEGTEFLKSAAQVQVFLNKLAYRQKHIIVETDKKSVEIIGKKESLIWNPTMPYFCQQWKVGDLCLVEIWLCLASLHV